MRTSSLLADVNFKALVDGFKTHRPEVSLVLSDTMVSEKDT